MVIISILIKKVSNPLKNEVGKNKILINKYFKDEKELNSTV